MAHNVSTEEAAARVGAVLWENRGNTLHLDELVSRTDLSVEQVRRAERYLKKFVNEHPKEFEGHVLYVALGNESKHGFVAEDYDLEVDRDVVRRVQYCLARAESELDYREQAVARVQDPRVRKHLRKGLEYARVARTAFEDAYEALDHSTK